jgi:hypothetical protein
MLILFQSYFVLFLFVFAWHEYALTINKRFVCYNTHDLMCETFTIVKVCIIEQYLIRHSVWVIYTSEAFMLTVFLALISSVHMIYYTSCM